MGFAELYITKHALFNPFVKSLPDKDLNMIVVIPCYNETKLIETFESLWNTNRTFNSTEILTIINSSIKTDPQVIENNKITCQIAQEWISNHFDSKLRYELIYKSDLPKKDFGVGFARKIGMDEAIHRFNSINNPEGIIINLDADTLCDANYLTTIENHFSKNPKTNGVSLYFEHPIEGNEFPDAVYKRIIQYELYLRYFINGLKYSQFPYSFHTIGSAFAVKAQTYSKQGGMNKRQGGEDFYFLHKIIPLGNYFEINSTRVLPSPRPSLRVPFGTGATISKLINEVDPHYYTNQVSAFTDLKELFARLPLFFKSQISEFENIIIKFPSTIKDFLTENNFKDELEKINQHSPNIKIFNYRFFQWFDAFRVVKFINYTREKNYPKVELLAASKELCKKLQINFTESWTEKEFLLKFRDIDRTGIF